MTQSLKEIFNTLRQKGYRVIAPCKVDGKVFFKEVGSPDEITLDYINPVLAAKEWFFPRTEVVMEYENHLSKDVRLKDDETQKAPVAIIGVRPCDAKSLQILDKVFSWDYKDELYLKRRQDALIAVFACNKAGGHCFCDKFGIGLDSTEGADVLLKDSGGGTLQVNAVSPKGKEVFPQAQTGEVEGEAPKEKAFDKQRIKAWLDGNFENGLWENIALKCLGCGACTFVCPTCHCFDVVDEASYTQGCRRKNWDSCSFANFTLHTSGHNPRPAQKDRFRNRIMHKFKYYQEKFGETACVGCGRCRRACSVNMDLKGILEQIEKR